MGIDEPCRVHGIRRCTICNPPARGNFEDRPGRTRRDDHSTSESGARSVAYRAKSQKIQLLRAYLAAGEYGRTADEAAGDTGLIARPNCQYWKRCGELRADHLIERKIVDGREVTRPGKSGEAQMVCVVTPKGRDVLRGLGGDAA